MGPADDAAEALLAAASEPAARLLEAVVELTAADGELIPIAPLLAELVCAVTNADGAAIARVEGDETVSVAATGLIAGTEGTRNKRDASLAGRVVATAESQVCADVEADPRVDVADARRLGIQSFAVVPVRHAHHTLALITLVSDRRDGITRDMVDFIDPLVRAAGARLAQVAATQSAAAQLALLQDVTETGRELLLADDPGQRLVVEVARLAAAQHVYLLLPTDDNRLVITRSSGHDLEGTVTAADATTLSGSAYVTGRPKIVADWTTHPSASAHLVHTLAADGSRSAVYVPLVTADGPVGVVAAIMREPITVGNADLVGLLQLLAAEAGIAITRDVLRRRLADQARTDPLTGLPNRRVWTERLDLERERAARSGAPLAVALLDLDHFKRFNDTFGHPAGDEVLREVAEVWGTTLRPTDLLARIGGEEFGVVLADTDLATATAALDRLRAVMPLNQTVSIGLVLASPEETADTTVRRADEALYAAKAAGRDRVVSR